MSKTQCQVTTETIPHQVPPALIKAGLPKGSVAGFLEGAASGDPSAFASVSGITPATQANAIRAYKVASADARRTVLFTSIALLGVGVILTSLAPVVRKRLTEEMTITLLDKIAEKALRSGEGSAVKRLTDREAGLAVTPNGVAMQSG